MNGSWNIPDGIWEITDDGNFAEGFFEI